jgi:hypothetical protein
MNAIGTFLCLAAVAALGACANPDSVLFVTATSIGINVDSKPPTASIAYDRVEGFLGPRYENGGLPPVVASIETGGTVFNPKIRQIYATGNAAERAVSDRPPPVEQRELSGDPNRRKLAFFGTGTTIGLKVGFGPQGVPDSLTFGYKRFEASLIPLGTKEVNGRQVDVYPSVLGSIDTVTQTSSLPATGLTSGQFFATGQAAEALASKERIRGAFVDLARTSIVSVVKSRGLAAPELQVRRKNAADFVRSLSLPDRDRLAQALDLRTGPQATGDIQVAIAQAVTVAEFDVIAQKIELLFGRKF